MKPYINRKKGQSKFHTLSIIRVMFLQHIGSRVWLWILMILMKRGRLRTLLFLSIYRLNCLGMSLLEMVLVLSIEKKHLTLHFRLLIPRGSIVLRRRWCMKKCWKRMRFLTVWRRKICRFWIETKLFKDFFSIIFSCNIYIHLNLKECIFSLIKDNFWSYLKVKVKKNISRSKIIIFSGL